MQWGGTHIWVPGTAGAMMTIWSLSGGGDLEVEVGEWERVGLCLELSLLDVRG